MYQMKAADVLRTRWCLRYTSICCSELRDLRSSSAIDLWGLAVVSRFVVIFLNNWERMRFQRDGGAQQLMMVHTTSRLEVTCQSMVSDQATRQSYPT